MYLFHLGLSEKTMSTLCCVHHLIISDSTSINSQKIIQVTYTLDPVIFWKWVYGQRDTLCWIYHSWSHWKPWISIIMLIKIVIYYTFPKLRFLFCFVCLKLRPLCFWTLLTFVWFSFLIFVSHRNRAGNSQRLSCHPRPNSVITTLSSVLASSFCCPGGDVYLLLNLLHNLNYLEVSSVKSQDWPHFKSAKHRPFEKSNILFKKVCISPKFHQ